MTLPAAMAVPPVSATNRSTLSQMTIAFKPALLGKYADRGDKRDRLAGSLIDGVSLVIWVGRCAVWQKVGAFL